MVRFAAKSFWIASLLVLHFRVSESLYFVPASLLGTSAGVITAAQALGIIGATGLVGAAGVAILAGKVLLVGKKKYYEPYGHGYNSNGGGYADGSYSGAPAYSNGAYGGPGYVGGFSYRSDDESYKTEHTVRRRSITSSPVHQSPVGLLDVLKQSYQGRGSSQSNQLLLSSETEAVMENLIHKVALRDFSGCGSRLVCELHRKPLDKLSPEEEVIVEFFRQRLTPLSTRKVAKNKLYEAALLGLTASPDNPAICSMVFHRCHIDSTVLHHEFLDAALEYQILN